MALYRCGSKKPKLQSKSVSPKTTAQTVTPDSNYDGLSQVTVSAASLQSKSVSPSASSQTVKPDSGKYGLSQVTVNAATLQAKTVSPSASAQTVKPDSGYLGLSQVTVPAALITPNTITLSFYIKVSPNNPAVPALNSTFQIFTADYNTVISSTIPSLPAGTSITPNTILTISYNHTASGTWEETVTVTLGKI